jgi:hypothetical protein
MSRKITPVTNDEYWMSRAWAAQAAAEMQTEICAKEQMLGTAEAYRRRAHCDWDAFQSLAVLRPRAACHEKTPSSAGAPLGVNAFCGMLFTEQD